MRIRVVAALALTAAAVAGCSGSSSSGSNAANTSPVVTPSVSSSASPSASASPSSSPSPTPTPSFSTTVKASHDCTTEDLSLTIGQSQGAAGSTIIPLVFTNSSKKPCTLYGYPGVSFLDSSEQQIGPSAARSGTEEAVVTLAPGQPANAQLQVPDPGNFTPSDCNRQTSTFVRAYPPNDKHYVDTNESIPVCTTQAGVSTISPITPGNGD